MSAKFLKYMKSSPDEISEMLNINPIAYIPFGSLEWHGPQNVLGVDSIKVIEICKRSAEITGGILFPCINWGAFKTLKFPFTFHFSQRSFIKMTKKIVTQLYNMGFRIIILLTGHYPLAQQKQVRKAAKLISKNHSDCFALGIPEQALVTDLDYLGDHAAMWETSLMWAINSDYVHLDKLPEGLNFPERGIIHGIFGKDPKKYASKERGMKILNEIVKRLSAAILEVKKNQSMEPFERIYKNFHNAMKSLRDIKLLFEVEGMTSVREGLEYLKWSWFKGKRYNPEYNYKYKS
ncbi:MAG: creatininase family protein [Promethearchaeota archaeon]